MVFKRFWFQCTLRILVLTATIFLFSYLLFQTDLHVTTALAALLVTAQAASLVNYVNKTNRDLSRLFRSVQYSDFSQTFSAEHRGGSYDDLRTAFNQVNQAFRKARAEKEEHFRYLQTVVQHVGVGLIAIKQDGKIELMNTAAKRFLARAGAPGPFRNVDALAVVSEELADALRRLGNNEKALVKVQARSGNLQLSVYATHFKMRDQSYKLVSLQNIQGELEEKEMEAWQNLVRVLTHEIMNSITPIASLASTANNLLSERNFGDVNGEGVEDARMALETIERRSQGLLYFVDSYRNLTRIPRPEIQIVKVTELVDRVDQLMRKQFSEAEVCFERQVKPEGLEVAADPQLVEQVLINLLTNALQAVNGHPEKQIKLSAEIDEHSHVIVKITDNGPGMSPEVQDKIFVPFFTTKKGGSGIGLSLSRQIMRLHGGSIRVQSKEGGPTSFVMRF